MSPSDAMLVKNWVEERDAEAFHEIVLRHAPMVYGTCKRILGNAEDAKDVAQEVFLRFVKAGDSVETSLGGWLHTLATRRSLDRIRCERRRQAREQRFCETRAPQEEVEWDDVQLFVDEAIAELPEELRAAVVLHFLEGHTHEAIAQREGITRSGVTRRIERSITRIRHALDRKGVPVRLEALAVMLEAYTGEALPPQLATGLGKLALSGLETAGSGAGAATQALRRALPTFPPKLKLGLALGAFCVVVGGTYFLVGEQGSSKGNETPAELRLQEALLEDNKQPDSATLRQGEDDPALGALEREASLAAVVSDETQNVRVALLPDAVSPRPAPRPLGSITGWVVDQDGNPVEEATVQVRGRHGGGSGVTELDGTFSVTLLASGSVIALAPGEEQEQGLCMVRAEHPGYVPATQKRVPLNSDDVELVLTQDAYVQGWVVDATTQQAIPEFETRISRVVTATEGPGTSGNPWTSFSSPAGEFVLPTTLAAQEIEARARGYARKKQRLFTQQGEIVEGLTLALTPGFDIRGVVLDGQTHEPVAQARVGIADGRIVRLDDSEFSAITGEDGRFELEGAASDALVDVKAWHSDYAPEVVIDHAVNAGRDLEILLSKGATVRGRVSRGGSPVPGLRIHMTNSFGRPYVTNVTPPERPCTMTWTGTDHGGKYELTRLTSGWHRLRIIDPDPNVPLNSRYLARIWVEVGRDETVELQHEVQEFGRIGGVLLGPEAFDDIAVSLQDARFPEEPLYMTGEKHDSNGPDEYGEFHFGPVSPGDYVVRVHLPGDPPSVLEQYCSVGNGEALDLPFTIEPQSGDEQEGEASETSTE